MVSDVLNLRLPSNWVTSKSENALFDISANQVIAQNLSAIADVNFQSFGVTANFLASATFKAADGTTAFMVANATGMTTFPAGKLTLTDFIVPSIATGDIMKSDGTSFKRLARGTANQVLSVNGAGTDLVWQSATADIPNGTLTTAQIASGETLLENPYDYIVRLFSGNYQAVNCHTGTIDQTSTTDIGAVVNPLLINNTSVLIKAASYNMTTGFLVSGTSRLKLFMEEGVIITVPNGFTGNAIKVTGTNTSLIQGGRFVENTSGGSKRLWNGVLIQPGPSNAQWDILKDIHIFDANISFNFDNDTGTGTGITGFYCENLIAENCVIGYQLLDSNGTKIARNTFINCQVQPIPTSGTTDGFKISGLQNNFYGCGVWDVYGGINTCTLSATSTSNMIYGGTLGQQGFTDSGTTNQLFDAYGIISKQAMTLKNGLTLNTSALPQATVTLAGPCGILLNNTSATTNYTQLVSHTDGKFYIESGGTSASGDVRDVFISGTNRTPLGFQFHNVTSAVNYIQAGSTITGSAPFFQIQGTDTNTGFRLIPKGTGKVQVTDGTDITKIVAFDVSGNTTAITGTLAFAFTTAKTITFPDTTGTVALLAQLTDGTTISGIVNAQIAGGAAIAYSKLNLTGAILNADLAGSIDKAKITNTAVTLSDVQTITGAKTFTTGLLKVADVADSNANLALAVTATASAVDYLTLINAATANPATVKLQATGSDSNINTLYSPKGTGKFQVSDGTDLTKILAIDLSGQTTAITTTFAVSSTTAKTITFPNTTTTLAGLAVAETWTAAQTFTTGLIKAADVVDANGNVALAFTATGSAVDGFTMINAATANPATVQLNATGTDTNVNLSIQSKGTGKVQMTNSGDTTKIIAFDPSGQTTATTYTLAMPLITANRTLNFPLITGTDTLMALGLNQTVTVQKVFNTGTLVASDIKNANGNIVITVGAVASSVTAITVTPTTTANPSSVKILASGSDTNTHLLIGGKGTGTTQIVGSADNTKVLAVNLSGMTTGITLTLSSSQSTAQTLTVPNITAGDTLAVLGLAQTFTAAQTYNAVNVLGTNADPAAGAGKIWLSSTNTDVLKYSNATKIFNITSAQGITSQKSETAADTSVLSFTPASQAGTYRISFVISVSAATAATLGWTATWTDSNGQAQAPTNLSLYKSGSATPILTNLVAANDAYYGEAIIDINNAGTAIVLKLTFTGTSFTARCTGIVEKLN